MDHDEPLAQWPYQRLAAILRDSIAAGRITGKLPTIAALAEQYEMSTGTVQRAVGELKAAGLIYGVAGLGLYVKGR